MNAGASQQRTPEHLLGSILGTCTLERILGRGGMGVVYLAQQSRPRRQVAVKVLLLALMPDPDRQVRFLKRFRREADAVAVLDHPNILPIFEYGEQTELAYLVMPYVGGGTLRDRVERKGPFPLAEVAGFLAQAAAALDYAHTHGVIHRDVKPQNMLLYPDKRLMLGDFGIAKVAAQAAIAEDGQLADPLTTLGHVVGTPDYIAPEQAMGQSVDARADIYSLGVVLFYMVTGRVPFVAPQPMTVAAKHVSEPPPPPRQFRPDLPAAAEAVILKAMAKDPAARYRSAGELSRAFRATLPALPAPAPSTERYPAPRLNVPPAGPPKAHSVRQEAPRVAPAAAEPPARKGRAPARRRWLALVVIMLLIALGAAGAYATAKIIGSQTPLAPAVTGSPTGRASTTINPSPTNTLTPTPTNTATTVPPPLYQAEQFEPQQNDVPDGLTARSPQIATTPEDFHQNNPGRVVDPTDPKGNYAWQKDIVVQVDQEGSTYLIIAIDQFANAGGAESYFQAVVGDLSQVQQGQIGQEEVEGVCCTNINNPGSYNLLFRDQNVTVLILVEMSSSDQAIQDARSVAMKMDQHVHPPSATLWADLLLPGRQSRRMSTAALG